MTDSIDSTGNTGGRLTQYLTGVVAYIIDTRRRMSRPPFLALESNIRNVVLKDVAAALSIMEGEGVLTAHQTLNEKAYSLNQHEK